MPLTRNQDRQQRREDDVIPAADANANENHEEHDSPHDRPHAESRSNNSTFNLDDVSALMASLQRSQAETFKNIMSYVMEQRSSTPAPPPMPPVNVDGTLARCRASFSGAPGESVEAFIDAIESYTECVQVSDANIIRGLAMLLSADAATWWLGLKHHISTWNEAKENLIYAYAPAFHHIEYIWKYLLPRRITKTQTSLLLVFVRLWQSYRGMILLKKYNLI